MTGYGRGECAQRGFKVTIEVSSVNRKQTEIAVNLPRDIEVLEAQIRDQINQRVARGRLTVRVSVHAAGGATKMRINSGLAKIYAKELRSLAKSLHLGETVTLDMLTRAPRRAATCGGNRRSGGTLAGNGKSPTMRPLDILLKMRAREGASLAKDLKSRVTSLRAGVRRVQDRAPKVAERYREQLLARIKAAGLEAPVLEDERLIKEIFYFADRKRHFGRNSRGSKATSSNSTTASNLRSRSGARSISCPRKSTARSTQSAPKPTIAPSRAKSFC